MKLQKSAIVQKAYRLRGICCAVILGILLTFPSGTISAQGIPDDVDPALIQKLLSSGVSPEELQDLMKSQGKFRRRKPQISPLDEARTKRLRDKSIFSRTDNQLNIPEFEPFSAIEKFFIRKIRGEDATSLSEGELDDEPELRQFGYNNFRKVEAKRDFNEFRNRDDEEVPLTGAISDSYVLGIGDDLVVTFHGREDEAVTVRIDREGQLALPKLPPISAAGRTFGELRGDLEARVAVSLLGTEVFLSLGSVRSFTVYVVGEVKSPGLHRLTSLSTILDAIVEAGGINKTGSLRQIEITRGDRRFLLDTYDLLISGGTNYDLSLVDGDRIFVPSVSATVAVAGDVRRPAIYELPYGRLEISVAELMQMSGGTIVPQGNRVLLVSMDAAGREITQEPEDLSRATIRGGEYIRIISAAGLVGGMIEIRGHVNRAGPRALALVPTIGALLQRNEIFKTDPYLNFAALRRADPQTLMTSLIPINLQPILDGELDIGLQNRDVLTIFGIDDIRFIISPEVQKVVRGLSGEAIPQVNDGLAAERCKAIDHLATVIDGERADRFVRAKYFSRRFGELSREMVGANNVGSLRECPEVFRRGPDLLAFLMEHSAILTGEVRRPGVYPVTAGTRLSGLFNAAGGLTVEADARIVEISRSGSGEGFGETRVNLDLNDPEGARAVIGPGDTIRVNAMHSVQELGPVLVEGEVFRPGIYNIQRGERLSEIIERAGGLTAQAFPKGAVFTRVAAREEERKSFERLADQLQLSLASNLLAISGTQGDNVGEVSIAAQQIVSQLREATPVGRVVIEADPTVLQVDPSLDTILQPGDRLVIPKRPNWIAVSGAVLNPGTVQFSPGTDPKDYINMVGGFSDAADEGRVFIVFPDGRAQPVKTAFWNYQSVQLIPGSSIVVPMDATPIRFMPIVREVTSIFSQLAIAAASLSVISRD